MQKTQTNSDQKPAAARQASLELARCVQIAHRLQTAFRALVRTFPEQASTVTEMARFLDIGRGICQRIMLALREETNPLEVLQRFPGIRGLELFLHSAEARHIDPVHISAARAAVDEYSSLIGAAGGSQRRLIANLARHTTTKSRNDPDLIVTTEESEALAARAALFESSTRITGTRSESRAEVLILRVHPDSQDEVEMVEASVLSDVTADSNSMPITRIARASSSKGVTESDRAALDPDATILGISPGSILERFSTLPLPNVTSRLHSGDFVQVFNPNGRTEKPLTMAVATAMSPAAPHPRLDSPPLWNCGMAIAIPSRWLLIDVYLERPLAQACVPTMSVINMGFNGPLGHRHPDDRWHDHFPDPPTLQLLGPGIARRASRAYPRAVELASYLFEKSGWDPSRYICIRCEVPFPIWNSQYVMTLDFSDATTSKTP